MARYNFNDLTGQRFGRLTVVERAENYKDGSARWHCLCDCGNMTTVHAHALKQGRIKSCGCLLAESSKKRMAQLMRKHGMSASKLYRVYTAMRERCEKPTCAEYHRYGGRGITVCEEWRNNRNAFFEWAMASGYKEGLQIDRINNDGNYCPENCRWVTLKQNCNNTSINVFLEHNGEIHTLSEWSNLLGINRSTIYSRHRAGKTPAEILSKTHLEKEKKHGTKN